MKLRLVLGIDVVKKIIIILLAILIATITTSFSFSMRKAYGMGKEDISKGILENLKDSRSELESILTILNSAKIDDRMDVMNTLETLRGRGEDVEDIIKAFRDNEIAKGQKLFKKYQAEILHKMNDLDHEIETSDSGEPADETKDSCVLATELEAKVKDLTEEIQVLKEKDAEQDEEIASLKSDISTTKEELTAMKEKVAEMEMNWFRTMVRLQTRIFLTPDQVHAVYQGALEKHAKFGEIGQRIKIDIQKLTDDIDEVEEKAEKGKLSDKNEKELKEKKAEKEKIDSVVDKLGKEFAMNEEVLKIFTEDGLVDEQGNFRGTRVAQAPVIQTGPQPAGTTPAQPQQPGVQNGQPQVPGQVIQPQVNTANGGFPMNPNQLSQLDATFKNFVVYQFMQPRVSQQSGWGQNQNGFTGQGQYPAQMGPYTNRGRRI